MLCLSCSALFYHPSREAFPLTPEMRQITFKDIFFLSEDGVRLHGRLFFTKRPVQGTLIQFHGNSGNLGHHAPALAWVTQHGYNLLTFDYRGYGQSESSPSPEGIRLDAFAFLQQAKRIHHDHAPGGIFVLVGHSLGGAIALRAAQDFPDKQLIDLVVLDSAFASYQKVVFEKLSSSWITWPLSPLANLIVSDKTSANLSSFRHPLLIIHSENDPIVPFKCAKSIYHQVASKKKTFWKGKEVGHILAFYSPQRQERFLKFLRENRPVLDTFKR